MKDRLKLCLLAASALPLTAQAQDIPPPQDQATAQDVSDSNDIVVTALKRADSVQSVPASITALSADSLAANAITSAEALASAVPGLQFASSSDNLQLAIRGISLDVATGVGEPAVAPYVNGVYIPRPTTPLVDFSDLSRIEVLRGPQGTLYGRNSTGGAVNFITATPSDSFEGNATIGTGSFNRILARATVSGPVAGDILGVRLSGSYEENDGPLLNLADGNRLGGQKRTYLHAAVALTPSSAFKVNFDAIYIREHSSTPNEFRFLEIVPGFFDGWPGLPVNTIGDSNRKIYSDFGADTRRNVLLLTNNMTLDISDKLSLKSITGYVRHNFTSVSDGDGTDQPITTVGDDVTGPIKNDSRSFSQEFNLSGSVGPVDFIAGIFYYREHTTPAFNVRFPIGLPLVGLPAGTSFIQRADDHTNSRAAFADVTINISDRLRAVGGIRISEDRKRVRQTQGTVIPGLPADALLVCNDQPFKARYRSTTPKGALQFDLAPRVLTYVQYQRGVKAGSYNLSVCGNQVRPETIDAYEAGIKSRFLDNAVTLNISAFQYDYKDLQVTFADEVGGRPTFVLDNAATARVKGLEFETVLRPSPRWTFENAVAYLDARYISYQGGFGADDFSGNRLNRAPKWTVQSAVQYRLPLSGFFSALTVRADAKLTDRIFFKPSNARIVSQRPTTVINGSVNLTAEDTGLTLRAFVRNLTNEDIKTSLFDSPAQGGVYGFRGLPRTWGLELSKDF